MAKINNSSNGEVRQELDDLQKKADKLFEWLVNNIDSPNWRHVKQNHNALQIKIENRRDRLQAYRQPVDYSRLQQLPKSINV